MNPGRPLSMLLDGLTEAHCTDGVAVTGIENHSRRVCSGDLYIALQGLRVHGLDFLPEAVAHGAFAVAWEGAHDSAPECPLPMVRVPDLHRKTGVIAGRFFDHPSQALSVIAVTGTDGKTSVSHLLAQALSCSGRRCGLVGTLGCGEFGHLLPIANTTPDALLLQRAMHSFKNSGVTHAVIEASSHGLHQDRLSGLDIDVAVFTNLGSDHSDYHASRADYAAAKRRLFEFEGLDYAVVNADDEFGVMMAGACAPGVRVLRYSASQADADAVLDEVRSHRDGLFVRARIDGAAVEMHSRLVGRFNAVNLLAALTTLTTQGMDAGKAAELLSQAQPVRGRMQCFGGAAQPLVVLDYAHTPQALETVLSCCREFAVHQLVCVFGCGGDRDRDKRPRMGKIAARLADRVIITDDNPRNEDPGRIVSDVRSGLGAGTAAVAVIRDRARAIRHAIADAGRDDVVVVAGKGHETRQLIGARELPFDDAAVIREALQSFSLSGGECAGGAA